MAARREPEARHGRREQALGLARDGAEVSNLAWTHYRVDADAAGAEPIALPPARDLHARPDRLAGVPGIPAVNVTRRQRRQLDLQIDAIEERAS